MRRWRPEGIRTSKTKNGVTTTYYLNGSQIMAEETSGNIIVYIYDASGAPVGMQYHAASYVDNVWDTFWYEKNLFGDIVAVYGNDGTKLISYTYDAWGQCSTFYHDGTTSASPVAKNPFRYRGYYYDSDLELYYLQARYYDSTTGRFINADSTLYHTMLGYNLFVYCNNNPINYYDPSGEDAVAFLWRWITGAGAVAAAEPTAFGELIAVFGIIVIGTVVVGEKLVDGFESLLEEDDDPPQSIIDPPQSIIEFDETEEIVNRSDSIKSEVTEKYDPNPYRRPGEKKQNRENRNKAREHLGWEPRNNRRDGKPAKVPKHTPSRKGHKKYFTIYSEIEIF